MSSNMKQAGKTLLNLLARNSDIVMDTYLGGSLSDGEHDDKAVERLIKADILKRPEPDQPLRLARSIRIMLEEMLRDERNRQVDSNVGSMLATLKTLTRHYKEALHLHDYPAADAYLAELNEQVFALKESLRLSTRSLWARINNEFGYVGTIEAKIRENKLAQDQVSELLASLELFRIDELAELAGDIRELRRLLVVSLQHTLVDCTQEMAVVQGRLLVLMGRFRELQGRTRLLKGFLLHCDQYPDYKPQDHTGRVNVPKLFNVADTMLAPAAADLSNQDEEHTLLQIAAQLKRPEQTQTDPTQTSEQSFELNPSNEFELPDDGLKQDVDRFFCSVIDEAKPLSALEFLNQQQLQWPQESWLYQVIGGYDSLPDEHRACFELDPDIRDHPQFSGNKIIEDVRVGLA